MDGCFQYIVANSEYLCFQVCEYDNLYLDMNGIIHKCSHPDNNDLHFQISEEKMYRDIFHYLSYLFQIINPKKVFYLAIDGVAPRAKMNQQRCRRYRFFFIKLNIYKMSRSIIVPDTVFSRLAKQKRFYRRRKTKEKNSRPRNASIVIALRPEPFSWLVFMNNCAISSNIKFPRIVRGRNAK